MPYDLVPQSDTGQIVEAVNYLLNNLNNGFNADPSTGQVIGPNNQIVGYLYKYIAVKYADSYDGSVNFSDSFSGKLYYGIRNSDSSVESTNPADYIWTQVTGGFGSTKQLYYTTTGGRQIDFRVDTTLPAVEWAPVPTGSIDLDVVTSGAVLSTTFVAFFQPSTLQVPYTTSPNFTGVVAKLYASNSQGYVNFTTAQTDSDPGFTNNTWRIGNSATTGNADISYANITVGAPTDGGGFAQWPIPTAMSSSPALITVPVRYKSSTGVVTQASPASIQVTFSTSGASTRIAFARIPGNPTPISGTIQTSGSSSYPSSSQSASVWGISTVWSGIDPNPSSTDSLYQSDGLYDPSTNLTTWTTPYISSLKVGSLSAITVNTGALTVTGDIQAGSASISGSSMSGSGAVIKGNTGYFAFGDSTNNITYNGTSIYFNGKIVNPSAVTAGTFSGSGWSGSMSVGGIALPVVYITRGSSGLEGLYVAESGSSSYTLASFVSSSSAIQTMEVYNQGSGGGAAKMFNTATSKQVWLAPGSYAIYSPSGGGKYYFVDGIGPFTGLHDGMMTIFDDAEQGDIIENVEVFYKTDIANVLMLVTKSTSANSKKAVGVLNNISTVEKTVPGSLWESYEIPRDNGTYETDVKLPSGFDLATLQSTYKVAQINAVGEGQINVCGENGDIQIGDLIVTSSIPGKGMKQSDDIVRNITVAKSQENVTFTSPTEVKQIACIYMGG